MSSPDAESEMRRLRVRWQTLKLHYQSGALTDWPKCPRCRGVLQPLALRWVCTNGTCGWRGKQQREQAS